MSIHTRKATPADIPLLESFQHKLITHERSIVPNLRQERDWAYYPIRSLLDGSRKSVIVIAEADGRPIGSGFGEIRPNEHYYTEPVHGYIGLIYVEEEYRGRNISTLIINELIHWFQAAGIEDIRLKVFAGNAGAIKAYEKLGFTPLLHEMKLNR